MREVFSDVALVARYAEVEVALAKAEAKCGVIPAGSRRPDRKARPTSPAFDFDLLRQETDIVGYPILPLVHQMVKQCGEAGRYVHWGATTQDIMDTAVVLQLRAALGSSSATSPSCETSSRTSRSATATRRWPGVPISSRRCR